MMIHIHKTHLIIYISHHQIKFEQLLFLDYFTSPLQALKQPFIERKVRQNMVTRAIEKLPILPQRMNSKKPTWNNIRYFFREVHLSQILKDDVPIQINVKGISDLHKEILGLLEVPISVYENLSIGWWQFRNT